MTLTIDLTPEQEKALRQRAEQVGLDISTYASRLLTEMPLATGGDAEKAPFLLDRLKQLGVLGAIKGRSGPGDGRAWSEIEAASDPL